MPETPITRDTVLAALAEHIGADRAVHADDLVLEISPGTLNVAGGMRRLRHVVEDLRDEGYHVCAWPKAGYFMAATEAELDTSCQYLYSRAMSSLRQIAAMKRVSLPDLRGQLRLPS